LTDKGRGKRRTESAGNPDRERKYAKTIGPREKTKMVEKYKGHELTDKSEGEERGEKKIH